MAHLAINNISLQHSNGDTQFSNINFILPEGLTGLVGNNGVGKSLLGDIIRGKVEATTGKVDLQGTLLFQPQNSHLAFTREETITEYFGATSKLKALQNIQNGSIAIQDFQTINEDWQFAQRFNLKLSQISKNITANSKLCDLSGGELNKVTLTNLLEKAAQSDSILILDEPSNHLDIHSKQWLAEQLVSFDGKCLIISHDRLLLNLCGHIAKLTRTGIELVESNYDKFARQSLQLQQARDKKLKHLQTQQKKAEHCAQRDTEKAQKRASNGAKKANKGGMPRILVGAKQNKAEASLSTQMAQHHNKLANIQQLIQGSQTERTNQPIKFGFGSSQHKLKRHLYVKDLVLPHVASSLSLEVKPNQKWHLSGANGSGKSTFLHLLNSLSLAKRSLKENEIKRETKPELLNLNINDSVILNSNICLLDQHNSLIQGQKTLLDNLTHFCPQQSLSDMRTLLASNGFKQGKVFQKAAHLSGGEKMRLAMLIVSLQQNSLLLLDEPDNHLDINSKDILADALLRFTGSFILVSHDQEFVDRCGITDSYSMS
ncbi:ATP-binding cassette domain-containing protein [Paraglaciecola arctica]|uniref:ATP-binding cassette domain-containing protein n=1 Tax=Paraglaciecola arctica TaxID=1128911 RepID=UPI001C07AFF5|nr:ATP-binding cassette domain-containing protein [Paraglaciecola arctica]MBU3001912.1 ATP-binding cassette domain-containing protein [Paraglaciecola arctica]